MCDVLWLQEMLETLLNYKQEINSSRHKCEHVGSFEKQTTDGDVVESALTHSHNQVLALPTTVMIQFLIYRHAHKFCTFS